MTHFHDLLSPRVQVIVFHIAAIFASLCAAVFVLGTLALLLVDGRIDSAEPLVQIGIAMFFFPIILMVPIIDHPKMKESRLSAAFIALPIAGFVSFMTLSISHDIAQERALKQLPAPQAVTVASVADWASEAGYDKVVIEADKRPLFHTTGSYERAQRSEQINQGPWIINVQRERFQAVNATAFDEFAARVDEGACAAQAATSDPLVCSADTNKLTITPPA